MEKEWIPIIGTLLGVLVGGFISSFTKWIELRHQIKQEDRKLIISKLEQLHEVLSEYLSICNNNSIKIVKIKHEGITLDALDQWNEELQKPLPKIFTLYNLYASELKNKQFELIDNITEFSETAFKYTQNQSDSLSVQKSLIKTQSTLRNLMDDVQKKLLEHIKVKKMIT